MDNKLSPLCWKCGVEIGNYVHCIWSCVKLQRYWSRVVDELSIIFGVQIDLNPLYLILGFPDVHIDSVKNRRLFNMLTFAARKNILLFWIKDHAPSLQSWHKLVMDCIPNEYISCMLRSSVDSFYKVWDPYLEHIGHTLSSSLLQGFPQR